MLTQHYTNVSKKSNMQRSPFPLKENLAVGKAEGEQAIKHASLFTGRIHICRLNAMSGRDPEILDHLLDLAKAWGVKVVTE